MTSTQQDADIDIASHRRYLSKIFIVASNTNQATIKLISHATRNAFTVLFQMLQHQIYFFPLATEFREQMKEKE